MMKKAMIFLAIFLVLAAGGVLFIHSNLNSIVKAAIEKYGSQAAHTEVRVGDVTLSLTEGKASITDFTLANPLGFANVKALSTGLISIAIDPSSIPGDGPIIVREVLIDKAQVNFEAKNNGESNLQAISKNTQDSSKATSSSDEASTEKKPARKVIIKDLYVRDSEIVITHPLLQGKSLSAPLPTIHLTNIGKDDGGATPAQVADLIIGSITTTASKVAASDLAKNLGASLKDLQNQAPQGIMNHVNGLLR